MKLLSIRVAFCLLTALVFAAQKSASSAQSSAPSEALRVQPASQLIDEGKFDQAISTLSELQKQTPEPKGVEHQLGIAYYRKSDFAQAEVAFGRAMQQDPDDREAVQ